MTNFTAYMCKTAFDHDMHSPNANVKIYSSLKDCKHLEKCTKQCGIVKVSIMFEKVAQAEDWPSLISEQD